MVVASIDIMQGKVVQLRQGSEKVLERNDAAALVETFDRYGEIALIDLDAAMAQGENLQMMKDLLPCGEFRVGGGIRTVERARELIALGARKVIIGSQAFENNRINGTFLAELVDAIGRHRVIVAVDALNRKIVTRGWKHQTEMSLFRAVEQLEPYASEFLFTCVEREGTMKGADFEQITELKNSTSRHITVAGGVASVEEVIEIAKIGCDVQLGMALYTGKIDLAESFVESLDWSKAELMPTVMQDENGQVLKLAYSTKEALRKALDTDNMDYYSRSRRWSWTGGERPNSSQTLIRLRADCDRDAVLATVKQSAAVCRNETCSCFSDRRFSLQKLHEMLSEPFEVQDAASLSLGTIKANVLQKAADVVKAETNDEIVREAADVVYMLSALLAKKTISIDEVFAELTRRKRL
ncbi:phosphoribosyl-ATP diphosphatase [candidate division KSB3 bacterium]|uniref:Histidine biosynthesis bifunctional protein HisIE n=1 Tax=candidate division KSB3 bacterium TaxID=2044937 RepID=A0A2G6E3M8_9BACT|nr:MAG: phosphoribosyl-ATP diphosphatase [candidate division KSB3 bacterium]PIE29151.1 MAG: phosphoribosyl-ATP diphosphatase [candidate division KSB3 bacterium]